MTESHRDTGVGILAAFLTVGLILFLTKLQSSGEALERISFKATPDPVFIGGLAVMLFSIIGIVVIYVAGREKR